MTLEEGQKKKKENIYQSLFSFEKQNKKRRK